MTARISLTEQEIEFVIASRDFAAERRPEAGALRFLSATMAY